MWERPQPTIKEFAALMPDGIRKGRTILSLVNVGVDNVAALPEFVLQILP